jgi:hypothetical protein
VLATVHSSTPAEAQQRIVAAFPAEEQASVCAQLADVTRAVISQRLVWREELDLRVPECAILVGNPATRSNIRSGQFFKLSTVLETGAKDGQWTIERYRKWLDSRREWYIPERPTLSDQHTDPTPPPPQGDRPPKPEAPGAPEVFVVDVDGESLTDILEELDEDGDRDAT